MAPYAIHVNALSSTLNAGDRSTALYQWDFGDPNGRYNTLVGWNVAHIYDNPGTYSVKLTITAQDGSVASTTSTVTVSADTRTKIYVSTSGNDSNSGTSTTSPVKTIARAFQLMNNNTEILFQRGGSYTVTSGPDINKNNVLVGAYGSGDRPVWKWTTAGSYDSICRLSDPCKDIVIQGIEFDTTFTPEYDTAVGVSPDGTNSTIRDCYFRDVGDAINCNRIPQGVLIMDNSAGTIGGYLVWCEGSDLTIIGNTVANSIEEHNIRLANTSRVFIGKNNLTNTIKSCIWDMTGTYTYVVGNTLKKGRLLIGPNFAVGASSERAKWCVADGNTILDEGIILYPGAEQTTLRNNYIRYNGGTAITAWAYDSSMNRNVNNLKVLNNTHYNNTTTVRFFDVGAGDASFTVANNLVVAPAMITGNYPSGNMWVQDSGLGVFSSISRNVWAIPQSTPWVANARHYVWPYWSEAAGYKTESQWAAYSVVSNEKYENVTLNSQYLPPSSSSAATWARKVNGVITDMYGNFRPSSGNWTAGAAELNPQSGGGTNPPPPPPPTGATYNMQDGTNWAVSVTANLIDGAWERGVPAGDGTRGDPIHDYDGSGACYLTGNRPGNSDVDGGSTYLTSPTVSMQGMAQPRLHVALWFYSQQLDNDLMTVEISNNNGSTWVKLEDLGNTNGWVNRTYNLSSFVTPTAQMKARFTARDDPNDSITEAAVDSVIFCDGCAAQSLADITGDGVVDIDDLLVVLVHWGSCSGGCPGDLNSDGQVDIEDLSMIILNWS
ncbi:MAG TPA: PKD domain-containing protein [Phycisphaerales bacterium]|nr:PKD domain-containing protein [Phycisphaerales bacterium]